MANFVRDLFKTLSYVPAAPGGSPEYDETLSRLDERLGSFAQAGARSRSAVSVRPGDCTVWGGNRSDMRGPTAENCRTLIESIAQEGGNLIPAVLRAGGPGTDCPYELLVGDRRRFAVDWLNRNGRPEIRLNALVVELNDEEAFRLSDIENQERDDIPELDRARSYRHALEHFYGGVQSRMAEAINLSNSQLSRLLALADMPDEVVAAFATRDELRVRHSEILTPLLRKPEQRAQLLAEAERIGVEQEQLCASGEKLIAAATVLSRLKDAATVDSPTPSDEAAITLRGIRLGTVAEGPEGLSVDLLVPKDADPDEVLAQLRNAILASRPTG